MNSQIKNFFKIAGLTCNDRRVPITCARLCGVHRISEIMFVNLWMKFAAHSHREVHLDNFLDRQEFNTLLWRNEQWLFDTSYENIPTYNQFLETEEGYIIFFEAAFEEHFAQVYIINKNNEDYVVDDEDDPLQQ